MLPITHKQRLSSPSIILWPSKTGSGRPVAQRLVSRNLLSTDLPFNISSRKILHHCVVAIEEYQFYSTVWQQQKNILQVSFTLASLRKILQHCVAIDEYLAPMDVQDEIFTMHLKIENIYIYIYNRPSLSLILHFVSLLPFFLFTFIIAAVVEDIQLRVNQT